MGLAPQNGIIPILAIGAAFAFVILLFGISIIAWIVS